MNHFLTVMIVGDSGHEKTRLMDLIKECINSSEYNITSENTLCNTEIMHLIIHDDMED